MIAATTEALDAAAALVAAARTGRRDPRAERRLAALDPTALAVALADPAHRLAFWLNVYNGAVRARLFQDPAAYRRRWRFFSASAITVAGRRLSPNAIEHGILRRSAFALSLGYLRNPVPSRFERMHRVGRVDPRIHFALNCGARSCPPLAAYDPEHLDAQLDAATRSYLSSETAVLDDGATVRVPRLLLWYVGDFGGKGGILRLLRRFEVIEPLAAPRVAFGAYDWTLAVGPSSSGVTLSTSPRGVDGRQSVDGPGHESWNVADEPLAGALPE
jgi:hypothetical protein